MRSPFVSRKRHDALLKRLAQMMAEEDTLESQLMDAEENARELQAQVDILMERERISK